MRNQIGRDGTIMVPYIGPVLVLGMTSTQVEELIESKLAPFFVTDLGIQVRVSRAA